MARANTRYDGSARDVPPLRQSPFKSDSHDQRRAEWCISKWHRQDEMLRGRDRQVEENVRMVAGQQWIVWSEMRGRFVDISRYLTDDEKRWRQLPVMNRLLLWFMLMHARMTENPPVLTFQPGPDRADSDLAEIMDPVFKHIWKEAEMLEVLDAMFSWMVPGGRAYLKSRIDPTGGEPVEYREDTMLSLLDPSGGAILDSDGNPIQRMAEGVPFDERGNPQAELVPHGDDFGFQVTGEPHIENEGQIVVDPLSCLEVRGEWGANLWHKKAWHMQRSFLTPEQAFEAFGVELEPDVAGEASENVGTVMRLLRGGGLFGAADSKQHWLGGATTDQQEFVTIYEYWQGPSRRRGMQKTKENPGGRQMIVTGSREVIRDGPRYAAFKFTSPIRCFDFVNLPGRPSGTSPQEMLNGAQRTRNRLDGQIMQHATLVANPTQIVDRGSGIKEGQIKNIPGQQVFANFQKNAKPIIYTTPPTLTRDVYEGRELLTTEIDSIGNIAGAEGDPPTTDPSGELVKELRYNSDRFIGPTMRRAVLSIARMGDDWMRMVPIVWDREKVINAAGDDNISRVITLYPETFKEGSVNIIPEPESMLPEGRGQRQARIYRFWQDGVWGPPDSVEARSMFLDLSRFPHMSAAHKPGGVDRTTAEQNIGRLLQGTPALRIPVYEWYEHAIHLFTLEKFMKGPQYLKLDTATKQQFVLFRRMLLEAQIEAEIADTKREAITVAAQRTTAVAVQANTMREQEKRGVEGEGAEPTAESESNAEQSAA